MKYKVVGYTNTQHLPKVHTTDLNNATLIKETFGLPHDVEQISEIWRSYSVWAEDEWIFEPSKGEIEDAFGVILEEAPDEAL